VNRGSDIAITGIGVEVPGLGEIGALLRAQPIAAPATFDPARKLGKKGLLYKDEATKLALCAVHEALTSAGLPARDLHSIAATGVVASSNLGNVDTVCRMIDTLYAGTTGDLSPMDAPNASSNIVASTIAIRFGCRAMNLMVCSGATAGLDALFVAANALKTRRADRMIVVGVEPKNLVVEQLVSSSLPADPDRLWVGEGAACVILEPLAAARQRRATIYGVVDGYAYFQAGNGVPSLSRPDFWLTPNQAWPSMRALVDSLRRQWDVAPPACDLSSTLGDLYGALGVFQSVAACCWLDAQHVDGEIARPLAALATAGGSWGDAAASVTIRRPS
jgi:3-oxoacyl-[acyl-carrier-protein] synthase II